MASDFYANLINKITKMIKQLNIYLKKFPSYERHALCREIRDSAYRIYTLTVEGDKKYQKKTTLTNLNIEHEKLRMLCFLAFEMGYFGWQERYKDGFRNPPQTEIDRRFTAVSVYIDEVGRMIGGWLKHDAGQRKAPA